MDVGFVVSDQSATRDASVRLPMHHLRAYVHASLVENTLHCSLPDRRWSLLLQSGFVGGKLAEDESCIVGIEAERGGWLHVAGRVRPARPPADETARGCVRGRARGGGGGGGA